MTGCDYIKRKAMVIVAERQIEQITFPQIPAAFISI